MNPPALPEARPSLWNPNAAACWSLLFSPAFGAYLHARNAEALDRTAEAKANRIWFRVSLAYFVFILVADYFFALPDQVYHGASIGLLVGWYSSLARQQAAHVKAEFGSDYVRKPWRKPLLVGLGGLLAFCAISIALEFVLEHI